MFQGLRHFFPLQKSMCQQQLHVQCVQKALMRLFNRHSYQEPVTHSLPTSGLVYHPPIGINEGNDALIIVAHKLIPNVKIESP